MANDNLALATVKELVSKFLIQHRPNRNERYIRVSYDTYADDCVALTRHVRDESGPGGMTLFPISSRVADLPLAEIISKRMFDTNLDVKLNPIVRGEIYGLKFEDTILECLNAVRTRYECDTVLTPLFQVALAICSRSTVDARWAKLHPFQLWRNKLTFCERCNSGEFISVIAKLSSTILQKITSIGVHEIIWKDATEQVMVKNEASIRKTERRSINIRRTVATTKRITLPALPHSVNPEELRPSEVAFSFFQEDEVNAEPIIVDYNDAFPTIKVPVVAKPQFIIPEVFVVSPEGEKSNAITGEVINKAPLTSAKSRRIRRKAAIKRQLIIPTQAPVPETHVQLIAHEQLPPTTNPDKAEEGKPTQKRVLSPQERAFLNAEATERKYREDAMAAYKDLLKKRKVDSWEPLTADECIIWNRGMRVKRAMRKDTFAKKRSAKIAKALKPKAVPGLKRNATKRQKRAAEDKSLPYYIPKWVGKASEKTSPKRAPRTVRVDGTRLQILAFEAKKREIEQTLSALITYMFATNTFDIKNPQYCLLTEEVSKVNLKIAELKEKPKDLTWTEVVTRAHEDTGREITRKEYKPVDWLTYFVSENKFNALLAVPDEDTKWFNPLRHFKRYRTPLKQRKNQIKPWLKKRSYKRATPKPTQSCPIFESEKYLKNLVCRIDIRLDTQYKRQEQIQLWHETQQYINKNYVKRSRRHLRKTERLMQIFEKHFKDVPPKYKRKDDNWKNQNVNELRNNCINRLKLELTPQFIICTSKSMHKRRAAYCRQTQWLLNKLNEINLKPKTRFPPEQNSILRMKLSYAKLFAKQNSQSISRVSDMAKNDSFKKCKYNIQKIFGRGSITLQDNKNDQIVAIFKNKNYHFVFIYDISNSTFYYPNHLLKKQNFDSDLDKNILQSIDQDLHVHIVGEEYILQEINGIKLFVEENSFIISGTPIYQDDKLVSMITWFVEHDGCKYYYVEPKEFVYVDIWMSERHYMNNDTKFECILEKTCPCNSYQINGNHLETGCAEGVIESQTFTGKVWCQCNHCSGKWRGPKENCTKPANHQHILGCRFGGPRNNKNCFQEWKFEPSWTNYEHILAEEVDAGKICEVVLDPNNKKYDINCTTHNCQIANTCHSDKKQPPEKQGQSTLSGTKPKQSKPLNVTKLQNLTSKIVAEKKKLQSAKKTEDTSKKQQKRSTARLNQLENELKQLSIRPKVAQKPLKETVIANTQNMVGNFDIDLDDDWQYSEEKRCVLPKMESGKIIWPMHCLTNEQIHQMKKTLHNYTDCLSSVIFAKITPTVFIGKKDGLKLKASRLVTLFAYYHDGEMLYYQVQNTILCDKNLKSGTPVFNEEGELCSVILQSKDSKLYGLVNFNNERGRISCTEFQIKEQEKPLIYGKEEFSFKPDLVSYISNAKETGKRNITLWIGSESRAHRLIMCDGDLEIWHHYISYPIVLKDMNNSFKNTRLIKFNNTNSFMRCLYMFLILFSLILPSVVSVSTEETRLQRLNLEMSQLEQQNNNVEALIYQQDYDILVKLENIEDEVKKAVVLANATLTPHVDQNLQNLNTELLRVNERVKRDSEQIGTLLRQQNALRQCIRLLKTTGEKYMEHLVFLNDSWTRQAVFRSKFRNYYTLDPDRLKQILVADNAKNAGKFKSLSIFAHGAITSSKSPITTPIPVITTEPTIQPLPILTIDVSELHSMWGIGRISSRDSCNIKDTLYDVHDLEVSQVCSRDSPEHFLNASCNHCAISNGRWLIDDNEEYYISSGQCEKTISCNLACLNSRTLYDLLSLQPRNINCFLPIIKALTQNAKPELHVYDVQDIDGYTTVRIYDEYILLLTTDKNWFFPRIFAIPETGCYKASLAKVDDKTFVRNGIFMCDILSPVEEESIFKTKRTIRPTQALGTFVTVLISISLVKHVGMFTSVFVLLAGSYFSLTQATDCNSDVISIASKLQKQNALENIWEVRAFMRENDCINMGDGLILSVDNILERVVYNYKQSMPQRITLTCVDWDYNCPMSANTVCGKDLSCFKKKINETVFKFNHCFSEKTHPDSSCIRSGAMNVYAEALVEVPKQLNQYIHIYEVQSSTLDTILSLTQFYDNNPTIKNRLNVTQARRYRSDDLTLSIENMEVFKSNTYKFIVNIGDNFWCAHTLPDITICISTNLYHPWKLVDKRCLTPTFEWNNNGLAAKYTGVQPSSLLTTYLQPCPSTISFDRTGVSFIGNYHSTSAYVEIISKKKVISTDIAWCDDFTNIKIVTTDCKKDWYKISIVSITGTVSKKCATRAYFEPCVAQSSTYFILQGTFDMKISVLCGVSQPRDLVLQVSNNIKKNYAISNWFCIDMNYALETVEQILVAPPSLTSNFNLSTIIDPWWWLNILKLYVSYIKFVIILVFLYFCMLALVQGNFLFAAILIGLCTILWQVPMVSAYGGEEPLFQLKNLIHRFSYRFGDFLSFANLDEVIELFDFILDIILVLASFYYALNILNHSLGLILAPLYVFTKFILDKNPIESLMCVFTKSNHIYYDIKENRIITYYISKLIPNKSWTQRSVATIPVEDDVIVYNGRVKYTSDNVINDIVATCKMVAVYVSVNQIKSKDRHTMITKLFKKDGVFFTAFIKNATDMYLFFARHTVRKEQLSNVKYITYGDMLVVLPNLNLGKIVNFINKNFDVTYDDNLYFSENLPGIFTERYQDLDTNSGKLLTCRFKHVTNCKVRGLRLIERNDIPEKTWEGLSGIVYKWHSGKSNTYKLQCTSVFTSDFTEIGAYNSPEFSTNEITIHSSDCGLLNVTINSLNPSEDRKIKFVKKTLTENIFLPQQLGGQDKLIPVPVRGIQVLHRSTAPYLYLSEQLFSFMRRVQNATFCETCEVTSSHVAVWDAGAEVIGWSPPESVYFYSPRLFHYKYSESEDTIIVPVEYEETQQEEEVSMIEIEEIEDRDEYDLFIAPATIVRIPGHDKKIKINDRCKWNKPIKSAMKELELQTQLGTDIRKWMPEIWNTDRKVTKCIEVSHMGLEDEIGVYFGIGRIGFNSIEDLIYFIPYIKTIGDIVFSFKDEIELSEFLTKLSTIETFDALDETILLGTNANITADTLETLVISYYHKNRLTPWPESAKRWDQLVCYSSKKTVHGAMTDVSNLVDIKGVSETSSYRLPEWICNNIFYNGVLCDTTASARFFGTNEKAATSYHVCKQGEIVYTNVSDIETPSEATTYSWGKTTSNVQEKRNDVGRFNGFEFDEPVQGEIYCCVDLVTSTKKFLICDRVNSKISTDSKVSWSIFRPVNIDFEKRLVKEDPNYGRLPGMSGSPIVSHDNKVVGMWGASQQIELNGKIVFGVLCNPVKPKSQHKGFFNDCVTKLMQTVLPYDKLYFYLIAPTGTGKTMIFSSTLANRLDSHATIIVLQPTVAAAWNAYRSICGYVDIEEIPDVCIKIDVGARNIDHSDIHLKGTKTIHVMTYGKFNSERDRYRTSCKYILIDEAHVRNDPTILETQAYLSQTGILCRTGPAIGLPIYMTATDCGLEEYGCSIQSNMLLSGTKYDISEEPLEDTDTSIEGGHVVLNLGATKGKSSRHPLWEKRKVKIPLDKISAGKTLIFVPTIVNTQDLEGQMRRQVGAIPIFKYHAGCGLNLGSIPDTAIIVTTDALGISVTVEGVKLVVDLSLELKPKIEWKYYANHSYQYNNKLQIQEISKQDSLQRKGRTGRTCPGAYMYLRTNHRETEMWDNNMMPNLVWEMAKRTKFNFEDWEKEVNKIQFVELKQKLILYGSIHPGKLEINKEKAILCSKVDNGDPIAYTLKTVYSEEWEKHQLDTSKDALVDHIFLKQVENNDFVMKYIKFCDHKVAEIREEYEKMVDVHKIVHADINQNFELERCDAKLFAADSRTAEEIVNRMKSKASKPVSTITFGPSTSQSAPTNDDETSMDSYSGLIIPLIGTIATVCGVSGLATWFVRNKCRKYVLQLSYINKDHLSGYAKDLPLMTVKDASFINMLDMILKKLKDIFVKNWSAIKNWIKQNKPESKTDEEPKKEEQPSPDEDSVGIEGIIAIIKAWCHANIPLIMTGAAALSGLTGIAAGFCCDELTKTFGPIISTPLWAIICCLITVFGGVVPGLITALTASIVYLFKNWGNPASSVARALNQYTGKCGSALVVGGAAGVLAGVAFAPEMLNFIGNRVIHAQSPIITHQSSTAGSWWIRDYASGGSHFIAAKHIYFLFVRILGGELTPDAALACIADLFVYFVNNFNLKMLYMLIAVGIMCGARYLCFTLKRQHVMQGGEKMKSETAYREWQTYMGQFEVFLDNFISVIAVACDPTSIITIAINWIKMVAMNDQTPTGQEFYKAFQDYAGVNMFVGVTTFFFSTVVQSLSRLSQVNADSSVLSIGAILAWIPSFVCDFISYAKKIIGYEPKVYTEDAFMSLGDFVWARKSNNTPEQVSELVTRWAKTQVPIDEKEQLVLIAITKKTVDSLPSDCKPIVEGLLARAIADNATVIFKEALFAEKDHDFINKTKAEMLKKMIKYYDDIHKPSLLSRTWTYCKNITWRFVNMIKTFLLWLWNLVKKATSNAITLAKQAAYQVGRIMGRGVKDGIFSWKAAKVVDNFTPLDERSSQFEMKYHLTQIEGVGVLYDWLQKNPSSVNIWIGALLNDVENSPTEKFCELLDTHKIQCINVDSVFAIIEVNIPSCLFHVTPEQLKKYLGVFHDCVVENEKLVFNLEGLVISAGWRWDNEVVEIAIEAANTVFYVYLQQSGIGKMTGYAICGGAWVNNLVELVLALKGTFNDTSIFDIGNFANVKVDQKFIGPYGKEFEKIQTKNFFSRAVGSCKLGFSRAQSILQVVKSGKLPTVSNSRQHARKIYHAIHHLVRQERDVRDKAHLIYPSLFRELHNHPVKDSIINLCKEQNGIALPPITPCWHNVESQYYELPCTDSLTDLQTAVSGTYIFVPTEIQAIDFCHLLYEDILTPLPNFNQDNQDEANIFADKLHNWCLKTRIQMIIKFNQSTSVCGVVGLCKCKILFDGDTLSYAKTIGPCHRIVDSLKDDDVLNVKNLILNKIEFEASQISKLLGDKKEYKYDCNIDAVIEEKDDETWKEEVLYELPIDENKLDILTRLSMQQVNTFSGLMQRVKEKSISPEVATRMLSSTFYGKVSHDSYNSIFACFTDFKGVAERFLASIFSTNNTDEAGRILQRANISLYGLNDDLPTFEVEKEEQKRVSGNDMPWMFGFNSIYKKKNLVDWHDSLLTKEESKQLLENSQKTTFADYEESYNSMMHRYRNLPFEQQKYLKYHNRVIPPHVSEKRRKHASGSAIKLQQINEIAPDFLQHSYKILDPCCGGGGFEQYLSYLGSQENQPDRVVYYQTLAQKDHELPNVNVLNIGNSKTKLVKCSEVNNGDIRDPAVQQNLKALDYDTLLIDVGEGDNNLIKAANWWMRSARQQLTSDKEDDLWNIFVAKYNLDLKYGGSISKYDKIKNINICGRPGNQNIPKTNVLALHKPKFDSWLKNYNHQKKDFYLTEILYREADVLLEHNIAHCISADLHMAKGVAENIATIFGKPLESDRISPSLYVSHNKNKLICHLVTKEVYFGKPTIETIWNGLITLKEYLVEHRIQEISMPKIACGLDNMNWALVENMIRCIFHKTNIKITICTLGGEKDNRVYKETIENYSDIYCYTNEGYKKTYLSIFKKIVSTLKEAKDLYTVSFSLDKMPIEFRVIIEHILKFLSTKFSLVFENKVDFSENRDWCSHLQAVENLINNLEIGGKMLLRQCHANKNSFYVLNRLLDHFKNVKVIKLPTCSNISGEFYLLATGFNPKFKRQTQEKILEILAPVIEESENKFLEFEKACRKPLKNLHKYVSRNDWFDVKVNDLITASIQVPADNEPNHFRLQIPSENIDILWAANWTKRMALIEHDIRQYDKKFSFKSSGRQWSALYTLGHYTRGAKPYRTQARHNADALIEEGASRVFGITKATSSYGPTQDTLLHTNESYAKRLDRNPGTPESTYLYDLYQTMKHHRTEYGKKLNNLTPLTKEETLAMINPKGSVGIFDKGGTMSRYIEENPDWYERAFRERIIPWAQGEETAEYFSVRNKLESKKRSDTSDTGLLEYKPGEINQEQLIENSEMAARQITFADALTRIGHLIIDGRRVHAHAHNKTYQGSITGTPPQYQGRVLKTIWELFEGKCTSGYLEDRDIYLEVEPIRSNSTSGIVLDFSKFDFTQTIAERAIQTEINCQCYPEKFNQDALRGAARHVAFSINVNDFGDVFGKEGMRNSGELWTSIDNTALALSHVKTCISRITGISIEELTKPIGKLYYYIGGGLSPDNTDIRYIIEEAKREVPIINGQRKLWKSYEICKVCVFADGDDIVIIGEKNVVAKIAKYIDKVVEDGNKILRSQDKSGVEYVYNFDDISFCSHKYRHVLINPDAEKSTHVGSKDTLCSTGTKRYWLQTREDSLTLGKMIHTMKVLTCKFNPDNEEAMSITRGKLMSYLLLYPHLRAVRAFCLTGMALLGEGKYELPYIRGVPFEVEGLTISNALFSLYGVVSLNSISYITYNEERLSLEIIKKNASLIGRRISSVFKDIELQCARWFKEAVNYTVKDLTILALHPNLIQALDALQFNTKEDEIHRRHNHRCDVCKQRYSHEHTFINLRHNKTRFECPWETCPNHFKNGTQNNGINIYNAIKVY